MKTCSSNAYLGTFRILILLLCISFTPPLPKPFTYSSNIGSANQFSRFACLRFRISRYEYLSGIQKRERLQSSKTFSRRYAGVALKHAKKGIKNEKRTGVLRSKRLSFTAIVYVLRPLGESKVKVSRRLLLCVLSL